MNRFFFPIQFDAKVQIGSTKTHLIENSAVTMEQRSVADV